ncbi:MAG: YraN family protein [Phycisphaeraceae bacterium]
MALAVLDWLRGLAERDPRRSLGGRGERVAAKHLKRQGYRVVARNLRCKVGEIDLLAEAPDGRTVVVVEVKAGRGGPLPPEVRVGAAKQRKLVSLAVQLVRRHRLHRRPIRFDVIGVDLPARGKPVVRHHVGAFEARV